MTTLSKAGLLRTATAAAVLCFNARFCVVQALASARDKPTARPMNRIAVIGAGISGLSVGHALHSLSGKTEDLQIQIFDSRPSLNIEDGAGIQLNGGMVALGKINKDLQRAVQDAGLPQKGVQSRAKAWKDPSPSNYDSLLQFDLESIVRNAGGYVADALIQEDQLLWCAIMRGALQEVLLERLPPGISTQFDKKVIDISSTDRTETGVMCRFSDGSAAGPFDIVIGCDGIKSAVKDFIETGQVKKGDIGLYSGIRIRYAVQDGDSSDPSPATESRLTQYFGDAAYALDGVYGAGKGRHPTKCAFTIFLDDSYIGPFKKKDNKKEETVSEAVDENVDWTQNVRKKTEDARELMLTQAKSSHLPEVDIVPTISNADRFFELGVYYHNPFTLNGWSKQISDDGSYAVLVGDAASAMPPFLGQGGNQAVQDAYCLANKICEYNDSFKKEPAGDDIEEVKSLKALLKEYEQVRWFPRASITVKSAFLGYLETGGPAGVYSKFRDLFFRFMGTIGVAQKVLLDAATPKF